MLHSLHHGATRTGSHSRGITHDATDAQNGGHAADAATFAALSMAHNLQILYFKTPNRNRMVKMLLLPTLLLVSGLTLASLTRGARAGPTSSGAFEASFSDLEKIGESNYTHFWMPAPLTLSSTLPNARLMAHVDLCVVAHCLHICLSFSYTTEHFVVQQ